MFRVVSHVPAVPGPLVVVVTSLACVFAILSSSSSPSAGVDAHPVPGEKAFRNITLKMHLRTSAFRPPAGDNFTVVDLGSPAAHFGDHDKDVVIEPLPEGVNPKTINKVE
jgi:hypothetical protein